MFEFLQDAGNYEDRRVGRFDEGDLMVSTATVSDGDHPFETAVKHPDYNGGEMVIVEAYDTKDQAEQGHVKWVATMTADPLPGTLVDCQNAKISQLIPAADLVFERSL